MNNALTKATVAGLAGASDIAADFVKYNKAVMSAAEILGFLAELVIPIRGGQIVAKAFAQSISNIANKASQIGKFYLSKINEFKGLANQIGFEFGSVAKQILAARKNLTYAFCQIYLSCSRLLLLYN
jgi:hypothetical protein